MRKRKIVLWISLFTCGIIGEGFAQQGFPFRMPEEKPSFLMSKAMERVYDNYEAATPQLNELYTNFKYTPLTGFDYHNDDGTVTRRDPSRIAVKDVYSTSGDTICGIQSVLLLPLL